MVKKAMAYPYNLLLASLLTVFVFFWMVNENNKTAVVFQALTGENTVAITVDDGPDPVYTLQILEILQRYEVPATFFVVGMQVERYPDILRREAALGNEVANHSYTHNNLHTMNLQEVTRELSRTNGIIRQYTGKNVTWFRPPRGAYNRMVTEAANQCGLKTVLWTVVVENRKNKTPEDMARRVVQTVKPGGIILLHDSRLDRTKTVQALPLIIEGLREKGYNFVTVSELLNGNKGESV